MTAPEGWVTIDFKPDPDGGNAWTVGNQVWLRWNWQDEMVCECTSKAWADAIVRLLNDANKRGPWVG